MLSMVMFTMATALFRFSDVDAYMVGRRCPSDQ
jgi:hypothetical protein